MAENLQLESVALAFGGLQVLQDVSLETRPGELLALIGPNGAGKTSVLNCICGIYRAGSGRISFRGEEITRSRPHEIARLGIARTFQHGELFPHLTVIENLLVARHARIPTRLLAEGLFLGSVRAAEAEHRRAVEEVLDFTDLERYRHRHVDELPFGIQKIVGFARALAMEPAVLLLDEPSAGLSRDEREDLARYILRIKFELGIPIVWVEHDMQMVADLADRIYVLDHGEPIAEGPPAEVLSNPKVVRAYLGSRSAPAAVGVS
jgi:branched-chain amino acid transport system ATP-binding protein